MLRHVPGGCRGLPAAHTGPLLGSLVGHSPCRRCCSSLRRRPIGCVVTGPTTTTSATPTAGEAVTTAGGAATKRLSAWRRRHGRCPARPRQTPFVRHGSVSGDGCDSVRGGREGTRGIRLWQVTSVAAVLAGRPQRRLVKRRRLTTGSGGWSVRPAAPRVLVPEGRTTSRRRPRVACQPGTSGCRGGSGRNWAAGGARRVLRPHASATVGTDGGISAPLIILVANRMAPPPPRPPTPHGGLRLTRAALPRNAATPRVDRRRATRCFPRRR